MTSSSRDSTPPSVPATDEESLPAGEGPSRERVETSLRRLDRLAGLLDDQFRIPGTDIRVGLDPILGVLPGGGDWIAWVAGVYVIWEGVRLEVPTRRLFVMAAHTIVDLVAGYVPVVGDLFDVAYRSNRRNVDLLFDYFDYRRRGGSDRELPDELPARTRSVWRGYLTGALLIVLLTVLAAAPIAVVWWLWGG